MSSEIDSRLFNLHLLLLLFALHLTHHLLLLLHLHLHCPRQSEVTQLHLIQIISDQYILGFEVPVEDLGLLAVVESEQDLEDDEFDFEDIKDSIGFE